MNTIVLTTARSILQVCLLILSGVLAYRIGLIRKEGEKYLNNILMHLALPAMILRSFQMDILFEKKGNDRPPRSRGKNGQRIEMFRVMIKAIELLVIFGDFFRYNLARH